MPVQAPPIDSRAIEAVVAQTQRLAEDFTNFEVEAAPAALLNHTLHEDIIDSGSGEMVASTGTVMDAELAERIAQIRAGDRVKVKGWQAPVSDGPRDAGGALMRIFGRLSELVIERLNQVPEKNFLVFLDLIGTQMLPPQPARVPLTFQPAAGSPTDTVVPARSRVAANPEEGETEPVVFETDRELVVTRSHLAAACTREPGRDRYRISTERVDGRVDRTFPVFQGELAVDHRLYLGLNELAGIQGGKSIFIHIKPAAGNHAWLPAVNWEYRAGDDWKPQAASFTFNTDTGTWQGILQNVPFQPAALVHQKQSSWLRASLTTSLPRGELEEDVATGGHWLCRSNVAPDAGFSADAAFNQFTVRDLSRPFYPFGQKAFLPVFCLSSREIFSKPDSQISIKINLDPNQPAGPSNDLELAWEYRIGADWQELGRSSPQSGSVAGSLSGFDDGTRAFTENGSIAFACPADWTEDTINDVTGFWLRVRIAAGDYGPPPNRRPPVIQDLLMSYRWPLPAVDTIQMGYHINRTRLLLDLAFSNQLALDLAKAFLPFGEQPKYNDTLYLAGREAFGRPGAVVTMDVSISNPRCAQASWPIPPVRPSSDLTVAWEYWNGSLWEQLGSAVPLPGELLLEPFQTPFAADTLTLKGQKPTGVTVQVIDWETGSSPAVDESTAGMWETTIRDLAEGLYIYKIATLIDDTPDMQLWAVAFRRATQVAVPYFSLEPVDGITAEARVTVKGKVPAGTIRVQLYNANQSQVPVEEVPDQGRFELTIDLLDGRNDLLVLARNKMGRFIAAEVLPVVRSVESAAYDFKDTTWAFTRSGKVSYKLPPKATSTNVNGENNLWLRARLAAGNYGEAARYEPVTDPETGQVKTFPDTDIPVYQLVPATFQPPSIHAVRVDYDYSLPLVTPDCTLTENDFVFKDCSEIAGTDGWSFTPFTPSADLQPTFYLGFERPGEETGFANTTTALYFGVAEATYDEAIAGKAVEPATVVWEYYNGSGWSHLGTRDETQGFIKRGLLTFIGPDDFRKSTQFGQEFFWIRCRWNRGEYIVAPRLRSVRTNTMWASHQETVGNEILGSGNGEPNQVFQTSKAPVLPGQCLEVREPELPSAEERKTIRTEEGRDAIPEITDSDAGLSEIWVRWHQVPDFYESGPRSRHYTLDRLTGRIQFGDGKRGMVPPRARGNIRATRYQAGGGPQGNRPAGTITQLKGSVPYVDSVTNREAAGGGSAGETLEAVKERGPKTLRHRERSVAIADFEELAFQASREVARVKGIPAQNGREAGTMGILIVPHSTEAQPIPSIELLDRVQRYLLERMTPTVNLWLGGPDWVQVTVTAEIVPESMEAATDIKTAVLNRLASFLHPLTGGHDGNGWAFGRKPYRSDLFALLEDTPGVNYIRKLAVEEAVAEKTTARPNRFLVYSGDHRIIMVG